MTNDTTPPTAPPPVRNAASARIVQQLFVDMHTNIQGELTGIADIELRAGIAGSLLTNRHPGLHAALIESVGRFGWLL